MSKKKEPKPEAYTPSQAAVIGGTAAGMAAHCARATKEIAELQKRCVYLLEHRKELGEQAATKAAIIHKVAIEIALESTRIHHLCDELNIIVNKKPKISTSIPEPNLL